MHWHLKISNQCAKGARSASVIGDGCNKKEKPASLVSNKLPADPLHHQPESDNDTQTSNFDMWGSGNDNSSADDDESVYTEFARMNIVDWVPENGVALADEGDEEGELVEDDDDRDETSGSDYGPGGGKRGSGGGGAGCGTR